MEHYYTAEKNIQMLIYLMKQHGVKKVIASPGTTNLTLVASLQIRFLNCTRRQRSDLRPIWPAGLLLKAESPSQSAAREPQLHVTIFLA